MSVILSLSSYKPELDQQARSPIAVPRALLAQPSARTAAPDSEKEKPNLEILGISWSPGRQDSLRYKGSLSTSYRFLFGNFRYSASAWFNWTGAPDRFEWTSPMQSGRQRRARTAGPSQGLPSSSQSDNLSHAHSKRVQADLDAQPLTASCCAARRRPHTEHGCGIRIRPIEIWDWTSLSRDLVSPRWHFSHVVTAGVMGKKRRGRREEEEEKEEEERGREEKEEERGRKESK
jgi:hypothetical protein